MEMVLMINSLSSFMISIKDLLAALQEQRNIQSERLDNALVAIVTAMAKTREYTERENSEKRDRTKELELSNLWKVAAIKVRRVDPRLAKRLLFKSFYWRDTMSLPRKTILEKGIALRQVEDEFKELFDRR
jgi:hypothetical protein